MRLTVLQLFILLLLLSSCIKNDIPYPFVVGEVLDFSVRGETSVRIDRENREIFLVMGELVDIREAEIVRLELTPDATTSLDINQNVDLTSKLQFTVRVFRDWIWTIHTTQPIKRFIEAQNQVGAAVFDSESKRAYFKVTESTNLASIDILELKLGPPVAKYTPDPTSIHDFTKPVEIIVEYWGIKDTWTLEAANATQMVNTLPPLEVWGGFAVLAGGIVQGSENMASFQYRQKGSGDNWKQITADILNGTSIRARISALKGNTDYQYRAVLGEEYGDILEFTTEETPLIPNMGFEDWTLDGRVWFPSTTNANTYWASGNQGVTIALAGGHDSNTFPTDDAVKGKAACIRTISVSVTNLAAGNIFTGNFVLNVLHPIRSARFARPYTGRPTKLAFWYKYFPETITVANSSHSQHLGEADRAHVYIYLGDWGSELIATDLNGVNTSGAIAFGTFSTDKRVSEYTKQEIELTYMDRTRRPTQIIIVATSSEFGEFFTGGVGSTLFVDELEFKFD